MNGEIITCHECGSQLLVDRALWHHVEHHADGTHSIINVVGRPAQPLDAP